MKEQKYREYVELLCEELIPAMGCTEPIALALAGAKGRELLGRLPEKVVVKASGSIIKNTKSVIVPNTNQMKGIPAAVSAGIIGGRSELQLQVISEVTAEEIKEIQQFVEHVPIYVEPLDEGHVFDMMVELYAGEHQSRVRITDTHTNIVYLEKDGEKIFRQTEQLETGSILYRMDMDMESVWDFAETVRLTDIEDILQRQIDYNLAIAREGLENNYGANIGKILKTTGGNDVRNRACYLAAAGSDARMNGCELPVVVNSGSGNQGMTVSLPVIAYALDMFGEKCLEKTAEPEIREKVLRALALANLIALYEKKGIGRLSAYCGAVSAGAAAAAGIAYLFGEGYEAVTHTVVNTLAISSGVICDGAKASCAGKIALAVHTGLMGYEMYQNGQQFYGGDGILVKGIDETLKNIGKLASEGMYETNRCIINMMTCC